MIRKIGRVGHSVPLNIGPARIVRVRPPVIAFREKIVYAAGTSRACRGRYCDRCFSQVLVRCFQNSGSITRGNIKTGLLRPDGQVADENHDKNGTELDHQHSTLYWDRGCPARKRARGALQLSRDSPNKYFALRALAGETPAVPVRALAFTRT